MPEKFTLTITLGNAAMTSARDVAHALRAVAVRLSNEGFDARSTAIMDPNGNKVGEWSA